MNHIHHILFPFMRLRALAVRLAAIIALALMAVPACAADTAKGYTIDDVPNVRLQDVRQYVADPSAILSATARDTINAVLSRLEQSTGIETAVVMLPSIGENDIFDFAHELFRKWGIGKKKSNNGLLILFVMDQHKVRFTTGYGIEGTMTDAMSKRIQTTVMVPRFKQADWDGGMVEGVRAAAKVLDGSMSPDADDGGGDDTFIAFFMLGLIVVVTIVVIVVLGEQQRCPKCRKRGTLQKVDSKLMRVGGSARSGGRRIRRTTYVCKYCGHIVVKDEDEPDGGDAFATGAVLGSMLGSGPRSGGGGGSFGGSFGGGSTGGGGSTSSW